MFDFYAEQLASTVPLLMAHREGESPLDYTSYTTQGSIFFLFLLYLFQTFCLLLHDFHQLLKRTLPPGWSLFHVSFVVQPECSLKFKNRAFLLTLL